MKQWLGVLVVVLLAAGGWFMFQSGQAPPESAATPEPAVDLPPEPVRPIQPEPEPEPEPLPSEPEPQFEPEPEPEVEQEPEPLPALGASDELAMQASAGMIGEDAAVRYLVSEAIIARAVASIDALGSSQVPPNLAVVNGPDSDYLATPDEWPEQIILNETGDVIPQFQTSEENYRRYTPYVELLESIDPQQAAATFRQYEPLFQEAWAQLGYGNSAFEDRLLEVIDELLATPVPQGPLQLQKPEAFYLFVDEDLETLPAGQKTLVRMGPQNAERAKAALRAIRQALVESA